MAFVKRAIEQANKESAQQSLPVQGESSDAMQALAKVLKKEDSTVHVKLGDHVSDMNLAELSRDCWPKGYVTCYSFVYPTDTRLCRVRRGRVGDGRREVDEERHH